MPEEDHFNEENVRLRGCLVKATDGTRQAASAWQEEVLKAMPEVNMNPGASSPCVFSST